MPSPDDQGLAVKAICAIFFGVLVWGAVLAQEVAAQEARPKARVTRTHRATLKTALELVRAEKLKEALVIYDELAAELDMNLLHLSRGRVLQRLGRCWEAQEAYARVDTAPRDPSFAAAEVAALRDDYAKGMETECAGRLKVACVPGEMLIQIDDGEAVVCGDSPIEVPAGEHVLKGIFHGQVSEVTVSIKGLGDHEVTVEMSHKQLVSAGKVLMGQDRTEEALDILEDALRKQESRVVYLTMSEALVQGEQCQSGWLALESARTAPLSGSLTEVELSRRINDLEGYFSNHCGERVQFRCKPAEMTLRIDGGKPQPCSATTVFIEEGLHSVEGRLVMAGQEEPLTLKRFFRAAPGEMTIVELRMVELELGPMATWGFTTGITGLGLMATALILDQTLLESELDAFEEDNNRFRGEAALDASRQTIERTRLANKILLSSGAAMVAIGATLLTIEIMSLEETPIKAEQAGVSQWILDGGAGVLVHGSW